MDIMAGWYLFILCIIANLAIYFMIDGYFEGLPGLGDDDDEG